MTVAGIYIPMTLFQLGLITFYSSKYKAAKGNQHLLLFYLL